MRNYDWLWDTCTQFNVLQKKDEFVPLLKIIDELPERKLCLEIGTNLGATSLVFSKMFDKVITVDIQEYDTWKDIDADNIERWVIDSHSPEFLEKLKGLEFDFVFIDGDHTSYGVKMDYGFIKPFVKDGGIIAFHDIKETDYHKKYDCYVHELWDLIKNNPQIHGYSEELIQDKNINQHTLYNVPDGMKNYANWGGIGVVCVGSYKKAELRDVTLVCADCSNIDGALNALSISLDFATPDSTVFLTSDLTFTESQISKMDSMDIKPIKIEPINSSDDYSKFVLTELYKYIDTKYALIVQHDGWVMCNNWQPDFYNYDYIGSLVTFNNLTQGQNGGFSFRSRRLLELCSILDYDGNTPEDQFIWDNRSFFENYGMEFAPDSISKLFSIDKGMWSGQFGMHNYPLTHLDLWTPFNYYLSRGEYIQPYDVSVVTCYDENIAPYADICAEANEMYCEKHGYRWVCHKELLDKSRPASWSKVLAIKRAFESGAKVVMWIDADAMILNPERKIEHHLTSKDIVIGKDFNGLNCGVMVLRNTPFSNQLMDILWESTEFINHMWWEQGALHYYWATTHSIREHFTVVSRRAFNSEIMDFDFSDHVIHLSGKPQSLRFMVIKSFYNLIYNRNNLKSAVSSGNLGDVVLSIPVLRELGIKDYRLFVSPNPIFNMPKTACESIKPLLEAEGFDVTIHETFPEDSDIFLDIFRYVKPDLFRTHLIKSISKAFGLEDRINYREKFVKNVPKSGFAFDVVINKTSRYSNPNFDWVFLLKGIKARIAFIGTKTEYEAFVMATGVNIGYYPTENLYEAAKIIANSKVFIGNQSSLCCVADAMQVNRIQETSPVCPNLKANFDNGIDVLNKSQLYSAKVKLFEWLELDWRNVL